MRDLSHQYSHKLCSEYLYKDNKRNMKGFLFLRLKLSLQYKNCVKNFFIL